MTVHFIGAGPGAADLITLRGLRLIERCPVCLYAGSLVPRDIVAAADWTYTSRNPLIRFRRGYFWEDIALIVKRCTGLTVGVHRNYRLVK